MAVWLQHHCQTPSIITGAALAWIPHPPVPSATEPPPAAGGAAPTPTPRKGTSPGNSQHIRQDLISAAACTTARAQLLRATQASGIPAIAKSNNPINAMSQLPSTSSLGGAEAEPSWIFPALRLKPLARSSGWRGVYWQCGSWGVALGCFPRGGLQALQHDGQGNRGRDGCLGRVGGSSEAGTLVAAKGPRDQARHPRCCAKGSLPPSHWQPGQGKRALCSHRAELLSHHARAKTCHEAS